MIEKMIASTGVLTLVCLQLCHTAIHKGGLLYPRASETRQVVTLDGIWDFAVPNNASPLAGMEQSWFKNDLKQVENAKIYKMPVPASYNDITTEWRLRDHVGVVWYGRTFFVPKYWSEIGRVWIRFGSVSYSAKVWINGKLVMSHEIGYIPFLCEITDYLKYGKENSVIVACDNTLQSNTIPQGSYYEVDSGRLSQRYPFDFFNYAGIDRPVHIYTTPKTYIDDITVATVDLQDSVALLEYKISVIQEVDCNITGRVSLLDKNNFIVANSHEYADGSLKVENPILWWPYLMDPNPGYMYTFQIELIDQHGDLLDKYSVPIGIRKLSWTNSSFLINNRPLYLHGFQRHEDSDIRGRGLDLSLILRDHNLIQWVGANAYRTSHYPYAEEIMDLADEFGIMVIDECPATHMGYSFDNLLEKHKISLTDLIQRDKNRPAVIMWSAANDPGMSTSEDYFRDVIEHIKTLDKTRPTTIVETGSPYGSSSYVDIISFSSCNGWFSEEGNLDTITSNVIREATAWHRHFNKPVIMQEYGAGSLPGLHISPSYIWSVEYQVELLSQHFTAFDKLREAGFFIGEFIWGFADYRTKQSYDRVAGNRNGIFTRNRQPKPSAHHLRTRYWGLAQEYANVTLPDDLPSYITSTLQERDEL